MWFHATVDFICEPPLAGENAPVLDCQGKLVLPGLIDTHGHTTLASISQLSAATADVGYLYLVAAQEAQRTLMRGFTSMRGAGGPAFALKRAIDEGLIAGPRIFASGAVISQTSGAMATSVFAATCPVPATGR